MAKILTVEFIEEWLDEGDYEKTVFINNAPVYLDSRAESLLERLLEVTSSEEIKVSDESFEKNLCVLKWTGDISGHQYYAIEKINTVMNIKGIEQWEGSFCEGELTHFFGEIPERIYIKA